MPVLIDLVDFAGSLDESLPGTVGRDLTAAAMPAVAGRVVLGQAALGDDDDRPARVRVPTGRASWVDRDLGHDDVRSGERDDRVRRERPTPQLEIGQPDRGRGRPRRDEDRSSCDRRRQARRSAVPI